MSRFVFILLCFIPYLGRADCWDKAGERYNIPSSLLKAIAEKESDLINLQSMLITMEVKIMV